MPSQTLASLPHDVLLIIIRYLEAEEFRRLRLLSRTCRDTFSDPFYLRTILRDYRYCHSREAQKLLPDCSDDELNQAFRTIAKRYHYLSTGQAFRLQKFNLRALDQSGSWYPTPQWDYHESQPGGRLYHESAAGHLRGMGWKPYLFRQTLWSYDDGLVVYAPALDRDNSYDWRGGEEDRIDNCLRVRDLETDTECTVPFDVSGRIIRQLRLKERTLIIEWAEREPFHDLNMVDKVHRHFATCYDVHVVRRSNQPTTPSPPKPITKPRSWSFTNLNLTTNSSSTTQNSTTLTITFRSEWRIHFLGLPLSTRDYFFSTHTAHHYAMYYWQPNRSLWTGDEDQPIEALFIWNISSPSSYRPSDDPANIRAQAIMSTGKGPRCIARYTMRELEFLGIRQHASISLMKIELDSEAERLLWHENRFSNQYGYFDPAERCWESRTTTFPFVGLGCVREEVGARELVGYRGHCSMDSDEVKGEVEKWFLPVCEVGDEVANVRFQLIETCFTGSMMENRLMIRAQIGGEEAEWRNMQDTIVTEVGAMGRIAGDERWLVGQNAKLQMVVARFQ